MQRIRRKNIHWQLSLLLHTTVLLQYLYCCSYRFLQYYLADLFLQLHCNCLLLHYLPMAARLIVSIASGPILMVLFFIPSNTAVESNVLVLDK